MKILNGIIFDENFQKTKQDLELSGNLISKICEKIPKEGNYWNAQDLMILPGFVDIHIHGVGGFEISDASVKSLQNISTILSKNGVTSFCPTTMTLSRDSLTECLHAIARCRGTERGAIIRGVHMEGPFLSVEKCGAQSATEIRPSSQEEFQHFEKIAPISLIDLAPEIPGALEFSKFASQRCRVSASHSNANYDTAVAGFGHGISHSTHLFCAMPPLHHRAPGLVGAVFDHPSVTAELICDGVHVHPALIRLALRILGPDRIAIVSDAIASAGLSEGIWRCNATEFHNRSGAAFLENGTLAGSTTLLFDAFKNLLRWRVKTDDALKMVTITPAQIIGIDHLVGSIAVGKQADLLLVDNDWNLKAVFCQGILQDL